jgi:histone H1/5
MSAMDTATGPVAPTLIAEPKKPAIEKKPKAKSASAAKTGVVKKAKADHPAWAEMITNAVKALNERGGSSVAAIKKYMMANYKIEADKATPFMRRGIKAALANGSLVQAKGKGLTGSFKLGAGAKPKKPAAATTKKVGEKKKVVAGATKTKTVADKKKVVKKPKASSAASPKKAAVAKSPVKANKKPKTAAAVKKVAPGTPTKKKVAAKKPATPAPAKKTTKSAKPKVIKKTATPKKTKTGLKTKTSNVHKTPKAPKPKTTKKVAAPKPKAKAASAQPAAAPSAQ